MKESFNGRTGHPLLPELAKYRYAHRGFHDKPNVPENSIPAFVRAAERGWGAELDVHLTKDGKLAVIHDSVLSRCTGAEGIVEETELKDLQALRLEGTENSIPSLDQVLEIFEGKTPLIIEVKTLGGNHREAVSRTLEKLKTYEGIFCLESFDPFAVAEMRRLAPEICRGQLSRDFTKDPYDLNGIKAFLATNLMLCHLGKPDFIAYRFEDRSNRRNQRFIEQKGLQGVSWTIQNKKDLLTAESEGLIPIFEKFDPDL